MLIKAALNLPVECVYHRTFKLLKITTGTFCMFLLAKFKAAPAFQSLSCLSYFALLSQSCWCCLAAHLTSAHQPRREHREEPLGPTPAPRPLPVDVGGCQTALRQGGWAR